MLVNLLHAPAGRTVRRVKTQDRIIHDERTVKLSQLRETVGFIEQPPHLINLPGVCR